MLGMRFYAEGGRVMGYIINHAQCSAVGVSICLNFICVQVVDVSVRYDETCHSSCESKIPMQRHVQSQTHTCAQKETPRTPSRFNPRHFVATLNFLSFRAALLSIESTAWSISGMLMSCNYGTVGPVKGQAAL